MTQAIIDGVSGGNECTSNAIANWERDLVNVGQAIAVCSEESFVPISNATDSFLSYIAERSAIAFENQNQALRAVAEVCGIKNYFQFNCILCFQVNPVVNNTQLTAFVQQRVDFIYRDFNSVTYPGLVGHLNIFLNFRNTVPNLYHTCINNAVLQLNDESIVLRNTLELC